MRLAINVTIGKYLEILETGKTPVSHDYYLGYLLTITAQKTIFYWKKVMYLGSSTQPHASISNAFYSHKPFYLT